MMTEDISRRIASSEPLKPFRDGIKQALNALGQRDVALATHVLTMLQNDLDAAERQFIAWFETRFPTKDFCTKYGCGSLSKSGSKIIEQLAEKAVEARMNEAKKIAREHARLFNMPEEQALQYVLMEMSGAMSVEEAQRTQAKSFEDFYQRHTADKVVSTYQRLVEQGVDPQTAWKRASEEARKK